MSTTILDSEVPVVFGGGSLVGTATVANDDETDSVVVHITVTNKGAAHQLRSITVKGIELRPRLDKPRRLKDGDGIVYI